MRSVEIVFCIGLGAIFLMSSAPKLRHPKGFVLAVLEYRVLPQSLGFLYAWIVPPLEFLVACLLLTGTLVFLAALLIALLLLSFMIAVSITTVRGRDLDCHCFGTKARRRTGWWLVLQDGVLLGAVLVVASLASVHTTVEAWSLYRVIEGGRSLDGVAVIASVGLTGSSVFLLRFSPSRGKRRRFPGAGFLRTERQSQ